MRARRTGGKQRLQLLGRLEAAVRDLDLGGRRIAVAMSGGVDSSALLHGLAELAPAHRLALAVAHVNHGLRGAESEGDEAFTRSQAMALGLPFAAERVEPGALVRGAGSSRSRPSLQEAARRLRRDALARLAGALGAERLATAHTADDQAETVLLRVLRGTGPAGLAGIAPSDPDGLWVRPLLRVSRAEVIAYARARSLTWREDRSNADLRYARSRLRHAHLPGLREAFNPRLLRAVGDLAEAMREESEWIEVAVGREARRRLAEGEDGALWIDPKDWEPAVLPNALARRLARHALHRVGAGREVSRVHLDRMVGFLRRAQVGRVLELPGGWKLTRRTRGFLLSRVSLPSGDAC